MAGAESTTERLVVTGAGWQVRDLGPVSPGGDVAMVEHAGELWLARPVGDDHQYVVTVLGADFRRDVQLDLRQPVLTSAMASTPAGVVLATSGFADFVPHVWVFADGENWTASTITDAAFDVAGVVWIDGTFIVSGARRVGNNPSSGPFEPALFKSSDGLEWSEVTTDDSLFAGQGAFGPLAIVGDRLVLAGRFDGDATPTRTLESVDGGVTWRVADDDGPAPSWLTAIGDTLVGADAYEFGSAVDQALVINRAGNWEPVDLAELIGPSERQSALPIGDDVAVFVVDVARSVEHCYEDPEICENSSRFLVALDDDGLPSVIDIGEPYIDPDAAAIGADGTLHLTITTGRGLELRSWPTSQGPPPTLPAPTLTEPNGPPLAEWDATLEVGKTYRFPLYTHCGISVLGRFNGMNWWLRETPAGEFHDVDGYVFGEIHVVDDDRIVYILDGRTVAVYEPRPEEFPGCG